MVHTRFPALFPLLILLYLPPTYDAVAPFFSLTPTLPSLTPSLTPRTYMKGMSTVTLWPVVHYAPRSHYEELLGRLRGRLSTTKVYEMICADELLEGITKNSFRLRQAVGPSGRDREFAKSKLSGSNGNGGGSGLLKLMMRSLGWGDGCGDAAEEHKIVPQLEAMDFYGLQQGGGGEGREEVPSWVLGDIPSQNFQGYSASPPSSRPLEIPLWLAFFALTPCPELFGLVFNSGFSLELLPFLTPANYGYATLLSVLHRSYRDPQPADVLARNDAALSAVREVEEATGSNSFDVVYGLCHMPGLESSLLRLGYSFSSCEEPLSLTTYTKRGFPYVPLALYAVLGGADFAAYAQQTVGQEWAGTIGYWARHGLLAFSLGRVLL